MRVNNWQNAFRRTVSGPRAALAFPDGVTGFAGRVLRPHARLSALAGWPSATPFAR
jgi:hypothetical protein